MAYIIREYPFKDELSNARLTKLVFLSDWKHCLRRGEQITDIEWFFDNFGPFVHDVLEEAKDNPDVFDVVETENYFGTRKTLIHLSDVHFEANISKDEKTSIDHVIEVTKPLSFKEFIQLVYSTFPITSSNRYASLDLPHLAEEYKSSDVKPDPTD